MNKYLKTGILLLTLAIPVFIWLFLKNFGQNQFALPVYYEESVPEVEGCDNLVSPHDIPLITAPDASLTSATDIEATASITFFLPEVCDEDCRLVLEQLANLQTIFSDNPDFQILLFASSASYSRLKLDSLKEQYLANPEVWKFVSVESSSFTQIQQCSYLLPEVAFENPLIMTDALGRIRGYYEGADGEEIDRLKGELKILFYMQETTIYD